MAQMVRAFTARLQAATLLMLHLVRHDSVHDLQYQCSRHPSNSIRSNLIGHCIQQQRYCCASHKLITRGWCNRYWQTPDDLTGLERYYECQTQQWPLLCEYALLSALTRRKYCLAYVQLYRVESAAQYPTQNAIFRCISSLCTTVTSYFVFVNVSYCRSRSAEREAREHVAL